MLRSGSDLHLFLSFQEGPLCAWTQTVYFSLTLLQRLVLPDHLQWQPCVWQTHLWTAQLSNRQPTRPPNLHFMSPRRTRGIKLSHMSCFQPQMTFASVWITSLLLVKGNTHLDLPWKHLLHQLSCPGASGKPSKDSLSFSLADSSITLFWHGFSSFSSPFQARYFPPTKSSDLHTHPWSLLSNRVPTRWLSSNLRFYLVFGFFQLVYGKRYLFSHRGEGRMVSFHTSRTWELKNLRVQVFLLTPHPGFSSSTSNTRDRALQPWALPKMSLWSWTALMWFTCNQGQLWGKRSMTRGWMTPLGIPLPHLEPQGHSALVPAQVMAGSLPGLAPQAQHPICSGPRQALGFACVQTSL